MNFDRNYINKSEFRVLLTKCGLTELDLRERGDLAIMLRAKDRLTPREYRAFSRALGIETPESGAPRTVRAGELFSRPWAKYEDFDD
jgi:hypothetical protein